jgi:PD-(D/E)XK nuclease superfamily
MGPPDYWSYSTLKEMETCPLRYCLTHANYPELWNQSGYPSLPSANALFGNLVHSALEVILRALSDSRVASPQSGEATDVLRGLGGLTAVVEKQTSRQLAPLEGNPRLSDDRRRRIGRELRGRTPEARAQVQTYLSRTAFVSKTSGGRRVTSGHKQSATRHRHELSEGSYAEVTLVSEELRLHGRVDLLNIAGEAIEIIDFKTGVVAQSHTDQLLLYALLWNADEESNPKQLRVSGLTAAYRDYDVSTEVPDSTHLDNLSAEVRAKIATADREAASDAPTAKPAPENCVSCAVRQLCATYWAGVADKTMVSQDSDWLDVEGIIGDQNGQRSWWLLGVSGKQDLLLRTSTPLPPFQIGDTVRIVGLRREADPDVPTAIVSLTVATEVFVMDRPSSHLLR